MYSCTQVTGRLFSEVRCHVGFSVRILFNVFITITHIASAGYSILQVQSSFHYITNNAYLEHITLKSKIREQVGIRVAKSIIPKSYLYRNLAKPSKFSSAGHLILL